MIKSLSENKLNTSKKFRRLFVNVIQEQVKGHDEVGLMLSGGVDSCAILYALLELDMQVHPYTFFLKDYESNDLISSKRLSEKYDLPLTVVKVPTSNIISDFKRLYELGCYKKTHFETKIHYLYLIPKVQEELLFYGVNADYWYGLIKSMVINGKKDYNMFNKLREKRYIEHNNEQYPIDMKIAKEYNIQLYDPYANEKIYKFFLNYDWEYLNKPYSKWIPVEAFKEYFIENGVRHHSNFQIESGMREYCKRFVNDPNLNVNNSKTVVGVYNSLMRKWSKNIK